MDTYAFFHLRRAEEERLKASRARSERVRTAHLKLASIFVERARQIGGGF